MKTPKIWIAAALAVVCLGFVPAAEVALKDVYKKDFYVGAALNARQIAGQVPQESEILRRHFNTISPENILKWGPVHPQPDVYNFKPADEYVALGQKHKMFVVGHTLVWHQQTPNWVFEDGQGQPASREVLLQRMQDHIRTVAGRYKGKINGWDVVNEALNEDGTLRKSKWLEIAGEDFLFQAFDAARKADPKAELYYNDYNMWKPEKRDGAIQLVRNLKAKGARVDGIGMQGHWGIEYPSIEQIEASIIAFSALGKVMITELDINVLPNPNNNQGGADLNQNYASDPQYNPYTSGLPDDMQQKLAARYGEIFALFHKHRDKISRVTFWGVADQNSWLNNWPIRGRTSYPLLFDRNYQPKPAFEAVVKAVGKAQ